MKFKYDEYISSPSDARKVTENIKFHWLVSILESMGINVEDCLPSSDNIEDRTIKEKAALREILKINKIFVVPTELGGVAIYVENEMVAEWANPEYKLVFDYSQVDPSKRKYTSIKIGYWSVFDEEE